MDENLIYMAFGVSAGILSLRLIWLWLARIATAFAAFIGAAFIQAFSDTVTSWIHEAISSIVEAVSRSFFSVILVNDSIDVSRLSVDLNIYLSKHKPLFQNVTVSTDYSEADSVDARFALGSSCLLAYERSLIHVSVDSRSTESKDSAYDEIIVTGLCGKDKLCRFLQTVQDCADRFRDESSNYTRQLLLMYPISNDSTEIPERSLNSVFLPKEIKEDTVNKIQRFFSNEPRMTALGIPNRMGFLLKGLPGSGKTSFVTALASHFDVDIHSLQINHGISDSDLRTAFSERMSGQFVLIEDISALKAVRQNQSSDDYDEDMAGVTLSGLLNAIDGIASPNNVVFFFTANNADRIDPSLRRAGRIDHEIEFGYATSEQIEEMFRWFYREHDDLETLAAEFLTQIGDRNASMAELTVVARTYLDSPRAAIDNVASYLDQRESERNKAKLPPKINLRSRKKTQ